MSSRSYQWEPEHSTKSHKHKLMMRKTQWIAGTLATLLVLTIWTVLPDSEQQEQGVQAPELRSEKSRRMEAWRNKQGYPDFFAEYHAGIRKLEGEETSTYPPNYRLTELKTARAARKTAGQLLPWVERGPGNVSGRTRALIVDPDDPTHRTWFAGSVGGGIWTTTDAGQSWLNLTPDLPNLAIASMGMAPSNHDVIYAGTGEGFFNTDAVAGAGIFKSTDRGDTWVQLPAIAADPNFRYVNRLIINPANENVVVAATNTGIFRTTNGGASWDEVYEGEGRVQQIAHQPGNFTVQLATVNSIGVIKSTDAGRTWALSSRGILGGARSELAFSLSEPGRVYLAVQAGADSDMYMSRDAGNTWQPVVETNAANEPNWLGSQGWYDNTIAVHPYNPDVIYMGGIGMWQAELFLGTRSFSGLTGIDEEGTTAFLDFINFGATHLRGGLELGTNEDEPVIDFTEADFTSVELRFGPGKKQMAHRFTPPDGPGVPRSQFPYADYIEVPFEVWDITNNQQLMVSFRDRLADGVYDLTQDNDEDQGREYIFVHAVPYDASAPDPNIGQDGGPLYKQMYFMWPILASGAVWDPDNLPESVLRINYETYEAQLRVSQQIAPNVHVDHHNITIIPVNEATNQFKILNGNDGGVYFSEDSGNTWQDTENGYNTTQFYGVDKRPGFSVYIGGTQDNGTWRSFNSPNASSGWIAATGGDGFDVAWHSQELRHIVSTSQFNAVFKTTDNGVNWNSATNGLTDVGQGQGQFITAIAKSIIDPDLLFTIGASGIWRTTDFADNWSLIPVPSEDWGFGGSGEVKISIATPNVVWAGYRMSNTGRMHVSTDRGVTFNAIDNPDIAPGARISGLATHPHDSSTAYVLFSVRGAPKILRTTDLGQTWEDISGFANSTDGQSTNGFPDVAIHTLLVLPNQPNEIWAGTEIGLFISKNNGTTWQYSDNGLPAVSIWEMRAADDEIVVATHGRGIWSVTAPELTIVSNEPEEATLPETFALSQNYPNPFNPTTTINFTVPEATNVRLTVYDVTGREVAVLADGPFIPGSHQVTWDAQNVASGTYLYRMEAGDFITSKRMTLVK